MSERTRILMGVKEVALHLKVGTSRVHTLWHEHPDFPKEIEVLYSGPIWWAEDIEKFAEIPRPVGRPRKKEKES